MANFKQLLAKIKKGPQDIVGINFCPSGVQCVRIKKTNGDTSVVSADILPAFTFDAESKELFHLPKPLQARYVSICVPGNDAVVKLLNLPGQLEGDVQTQIKEHLGVGAGDYRIGYRVITHGHGRTETKLLAVAIPEAEAQSACALFSVGWPAPISVEISGLAAMTAFLQGPAMAHQEQAVGVIELGARVTFATFFNKGEFVLIRKFDSGYFDLIDRIQQNMSVDHATAANIMADGSFDISQIVKEVSEPFIKQLVISKHFIERRENCRIARLYSPSGKMISRDWLNEVKSAVGVNVEFWNPFEGILMPDAIAQQFEGQFAHFSSALGAVLGTFEESAAE